MITSQQYINYLEEMIATPGWSILVEEAHTQIYQFQLDAIEAANWGEVQRLRGKAEQLAELCSLPDIVANQREEMELAEIVDDANL